MNQSTPAPLIVTLKLDQASFTTLDALRQAYFPPERNVIPAHVTLFHALPGEQLERVAFMIDTVCQQTERFQIRFAQPRSLGRGVAIMIDSPRLLQVRSQLAADWSAWLTSQDRQRYQPHITIQNKVSSAAAQHLLATFTATWQPLTATAEGLLLWRYLGGPWAHAGEFTFRTNDER